MQLHFIDEYRTYVHSVVSVGGLPLFENIYDSIVFKLCKSKAFKHAALTLYYKPFNRKALKHDRVFLLKGKT